jgi:hypothetical protein
MHAASGKYATLAIEPRFRDWDVGQSDVLSQRV